MMKGRLTLPIQQMMMMIAKVRLPLLPCHQADSTEEVRSGSRRWGKSQKEPHLFSAIENSKEVIVGS